MNADNAVRAGKGVNSGVVDDVKTKMAPLLRMAGKVVTYAAYVAQCFGIIN